MYERKNRVNRLALLLLFGLLSFLLFLPPLHPPKDVERVKLIIGENCVVLKGSSGSLKIPVDREVLGRGGYANPYDFFSNLVDSSKIERIEIVPSPSEKLCRVITYDGRSYAGKVEFCIALAIRKEIPVYVHEELLETSRKISEGF